MEAETAAGTVKVGPVLNATVYPEVPPVGEIWIEPLQSALQVTLLVIAFAKIGGGPVHVFV